MTLTNKQTFIKLFDSTKSSFVDELMKLRGLDRKEELTVSDHLLKHIWRGE